VGYHQKNNIQGQSANPHVGEGGIVKRGNPYQIDGQWYYPLASGDTYDEVGVASWYGTKFHGKKTANGETYDMHAMTAAHTTLPIPSVVRVTNLENGKAIEVRVNDRGPFVKSRLIDLSYAAAKALGYRKQGTTRVRVQVIHSADVSAEIVSDRPIETPEVALTPALSVKPALVVEPVLRVKPPLDAGAVLSEEPPLSVESILSVEKNQGAAKFEMAYVQVGAFSSKNSAEAVVQRLQNNQQIVLAKVMPVGQLFRVRLGPFDLDTEAEVALKNVHNEGYDKAMIIHD